MKKLYAQSGVNIANADKLISIISSDSKDGNIGRFGAVVEHEFLKDYYLVTTTDGIGSKITPLIERKMYDVVANDLIAMNLNDLACSGACPLSFCDYISANRLDYAVLSEIILELKKQLKNFSCNLVGGETSELGSIVKYGKIDIAGFATGIVKKENLLDKSNVADGDVIIGLCSSGIHSNGFSLVNYLYQTKELDEKDFEYCLRPTIVYINEILSVSHLLKSAANITGGGIISNLKRAVPASWGIDLDFDRIPRQDIFVKLKRICQNEAYEVFNMGVGFCVITSEAHCVQVMKILSLYNPFIFGRVIAK